MPILDESERKLSKELIKPHLKPRELDSGNTIAPLFDRIGSWDERRIVTRCRILGIVKACYQLHRCEVSKEYYLSLRRFENRNTPNSKNTDTCLTPQTN
ncbi:hypothetical protein LEP1GSC005_4135 [Leptospira santarosai str. ST188]|nr:hypothetical protein LEP1GSC005_4135 [Leptospira santarosai str. ST188]